MSDIEDMIEARNSRVPESNQAGQPLSGKGDFAEGFDAGPADGSGTTQKMRRTVTNVERYLGLTYDILLEFYTTGGVPSVDCRLWCFFTGSSE